MKTKLILLAFVILLAEVSFAFDSQKLDFDVKAMGIVLQKFTNSEHTQSHSAGIYLEGYGVVVQYMINVRSRSDRFMILDKSRYGMVPFLSKDNEELLEIIITYLPTIRQIKKGDRIVFVIEPFYGSLRKNLVIHLQGKDLLAYKKGEIEAEKLKERMMIEEDTLFIGKKENKFDSAKLNLDVSIVQALLQRVGNPAYAGHIKSPSPFYLEGYGLLINCNIKTIKEADFSKGNEEFIRVLTHYLSQVRQLKENDRIVIFINSSQHKPKKKWLIQLKNKDLIAFKKGKIDKEELKERIVIEGDSLFVRK
jgi:hypothetical protein